MRTPPEGFAVADGIAVKQLGELPQAILDDRLDSMVEVSSAEIAQAIVLVLERTKLVVEGRRCCGRGGRARWQASKAQVPSP